MLKIQKSLSFIFWNTRKRKIIKKYRELKKLSNLTKNENEARQLAALNRILNHAYNNVPYYKNVIIDSGLLEENKVQLTSLAQMQQLPFLTKGIIRGEKENLYSEDIIERKSFKNTSGGSTGEPMGFLQDWNYQINNLANAFLVRSWKGLSPYDRVIRLWGAERDTFEGVKPFKEKVKDFILNMIRLNTFSLDENTIKKYVKILNKTKPILIMAYVQSIYEIAKFAKRNNLKVEKQNAIHAAAGTVHDFMRDEIEEVFQCKLFNYYGTRETGSIASECNDHHGLHILMENVFVELVDKEGNNCKFGEEGEIVITTLNNFSMPLIRYKIGDIGIMKRYEKCGCGCNYPKLQKVVGRKTELFKTISGSIVMPEYFIHLIGVVCNPGSIKMFQVVQEKSDLIVIKIVKEGDISNLILSEIESKIKIVMGNDCRVVFDFMDNIPKTKTGKFLYTISKV